MKKLCICVCFFVCLVFLCGCTKEDFKILKNNLAEYTTETYCAEDANFKIVFKSGLREKKYNGDGVATKLCEFGVLTCFVTSGKLKQHKMKFCLDIDGEKFENDFLVNPLDNSFVFDVEKRFENIKNVNVQIIYDNKTKSYNLINVLNQTDLSANKALKIATKELSKSIAKIKTGSHLNGEVYVRLIANNALSGSKFLWYISIYSISKQTFAIIIDPKTSQVLAKKC